MDDVRTPDPPAAHGKDRAGPVTAAAGRDPGEVLARRVRDRLASHADVREVRMFGGLAFMVAGRMAVSVGREGDLLVRSRPEDHDELLGRGGGPAVMGRDRPMGQGWVRVPPAALHDDADLDRWVQTGLSSQDA